MSQRTAAAGLASERASNNGFKTAAETDWCNHGEQERRGWLGCKNHKAKGNRMCQHIAEMLFEAEAYRTEKSRLDVQDLAESLFELQRQCLIKFLPCAANTSRDTDSIEVLFKCLIRKLGNVLMSPGVGAEHMWKVSGGAAAKCCPNGAS